MSDDDVFEIPQIRILKEWLGGQRTYYLPEDWMDFVETAGFDDEDASYDLVMEVQEYKEVLVNYSSEPEFIERYTDVTLPV